MPTPSLDDLLDRARAGGAVAVRGGRLLRFPATALCFGPDGQALAVDCEDLRSVRSPRASRVRWSTPTLERLAANTALHSVAAGPGLVVAGRRDGKLLVFDGDGRYVRAATVAGSPVTHAALSADGALVLCGTQEGKARLLRLPSGEVACDLDAPPGPWVGTAFLRGGLLATASRGGLLRLFAPTGERLLSWQAPAPIARMSAAPDGRWLALVLHGDRAARLLDFRGLGERLAEMGLPLP
ncbi:MAG: hypothetical protein K2W96_25255 [Gemmataceae bacterium]|nr:hypothetical protein [Gemmataceae bacterium]